MLLYSFYTLQFFRSIDNIINIQHTQSGGGTKETITYSDSSIIMQKVFSFSSQRVGFIIPSNKHIYKEQNVYLQYNN